MWYLLAIVSLFVFLYRGAISDKVIDKYGEHLMKDPVFLKELDKSNAAYAEAQEGLKSAVRDLMQDPEYQRIQKCVDAMQDVRKGIALHALIKDIEDKYNVDAQTAIETVRVGLTSGKMKLDPDAHIDKAGLMETMFTVHPKE